MDLSSIIDEITKKKKRKAILSVPRIGISTTLKKTLYNNKCEIFYEKFMKYKEKLSLTSYSSFMNEY